MQREPKDFFFHMHSLQTRILNSGSIQSEPASWAPFPQLWRRYATQFYPISLESAAINQHIPLTGIEEQRTCVTSGEKELDVTTLPQGLQRYVWESCIFIWNDLHPPPLLHKAFTFSWWIPLLKCTSITWKRRHSLLLPWEDSSLWNWGATKSLERYKMW